MAGHPDPERFAREFDADDRAIANYLIDEVLSTQPEQVREILLQTSIVDRVSGDLAGDLTGYAQAGEAIAGLAWANTFIQPLGHGWYRYHWLFREVLRLTLRRECAQKVAELHCRAARWFWRHGTLTEAVAQAAQGADWELAARIAVAELAIGQLAEPGAVAALADWLRRMPADLEHKEPMYSLVLAALAARDLQDGPSGRSRAGSIAAGRGHDPACPGPPRRGLRRRGGCRGAGRRPAGQLAT
jgi:LuxR family maltose regulon positive regulatory protein